MAGLGARAPGSDSPRTPAADRRASSGEQLAANALWNSQAPSSPAPEPRADRATTHWDFGARVGVAVVDPFCWEAAAQVVDQGDRLCKSLMANPWLTPLERRDSPVGRPPTGSTAQCPVSRLALGRRETYVRLASPLAIEKWSYQVESAPPRRRASLTSTRYGRPLAIARKHRSSAPPSSAGSSTRSASTP